MKLKNVKLIYSFFIVVLYFVFGILLLLKFLVWQEVPNFGMAAFGVLVLLYGSFRGYRTYIEFKELKAKHVETEN